MEMTWSFGKGGYGLKKGKTTMFEIRINNYDDRVAVVRALVEAGYTVRIDERHRTDAIYSSSRDVFVVIVDAPKLPEYKPEQ
jgi:hypothetical protein